MTQIVSRYPIRLGDTDEWVLFNRSSTLIYYHADASVSPSNFEGTIGSGEQATLDEPKYFITAAGTAPADVLTLDRQQTLGLGSPDLSALQDELDALANYGEPGLLTYDDATYTPKRADTGQYVRLTTGSVFVTTEGVSPCSATNTFFILNLGVAAVPITFDAGVSVVQAGVLTIPVGGRVQLLYLGSDLWDVFNADVAVISPVPPPVLSGAAPALVTLTSTSTTLDSLTPGGWTPAIGAGTTVVQTLQIEATLGVGNYADVGWTTGTSYTIVGGDRGKACRLKVVATANGQNTTAFSASQTVPLSGIPVNSVIPTITDTSDVAIPGGTVVAGTTIKVQRGTWSNSPTGYSTQIIAVAANGTETSRGFTPTAGYDTSTVTYLTQSTDNKIYAKVIANNASGPGTVVSTAQLIVTVTSQAPARDPFLLPFAAVPWNRAIGASATFATPGSAITGGNAINVASYTMAPAQAVTGDPLANVTDTDHGNVVSQYRVPSTAVISAPTHTTNGVILPDGDSNLVVVDPTKTYVDETWVTTKTNNTTFSCRRHIRVRVDDQGSGFEGGIRGAGSSCMAGLIRTGDVTGGVIPHALALIIGYAMAKRGWVWPAISEDSYNASYSGTIPLGTRLAIPGTVNINGLGLSADGLVLARCLQDYGVYVVDTTAPGGSASDATLCAEQALNGNSHLAAMATAWSGTLRAQMKLVTNATQANPGGPGTPRQPDPGPTSSTPTNPTNPTVVTAEAAGVVTTGASYAASTFMVWGYDFSDVTNDECLVGCAWGSTGTLDTVDLYVAGTSTNPVMSATRVGSTVTAGSGATQRNVGVFRFENPPTGHYDIIARFTTAAVDMCMGIVAAYPVNQAAPVGTAGTQSVAATQSRFDVTTTGGAATDLLVGFHSIRNADLVNVTAFTGTTIAAKALVGTNQVLAISTQQGGTGTQTTSIDWVGNDNGASMVVPLKYG